MFLLEMLLELIAVVLDLLLCHGLSDRVGDSRDTIHRNREERKRR